MTTTPRILTADTKRHHYTVAPSALVRGAWSVARYSASGRGGKSVAIQVTLRVAVAAVRSDARDAGLSLRCVRPQIVR